MKLTKHTHLRMFLFLTHIFFVVNIHFYFYFRLFCFTLDFFLLLKYHVTVISTSDLDIHALKTRRRLLELIYAGKGGHTGGSLSSVDILVCLYYHVLKIRPEEPAWPDRDRFVLSKGHAVEGYYCILSDLGFFPESILQTYGQPGSLLNGHPTAKVPGVEFNTGALGHGLSAGVGMALAAKMDKKDYRVFVLMGDGEQAEGSVWEAAMAGSHFKLSNLIAIIDRNRLQISGDTEDVMALDDLKARWASFGWNTKEVDGHNFKELIDIFEEPKKNSMPTMIIARTVKGKGVSFMENQAGWHHRVPKDEELAKAFEELSPAMELQE